MGSEESDLSQWKYMNVLHFLSDVGNVSTIKTASNLQRASNVTPASRVNEFDFLDTSQTNVDTSPSLSDTTQDVASSSFSTPAADQDQVADFSSDVSSSVDAASTITTPNGRVQSFSSKLKRKGRESSAWDKAFESIGIYFSARAKQICNRTSHLNRTTKENVELDDDELFARLLVADLKKIENVRTKRRLRKAINDLVYEALENQEDEKEQEQADFASFFINPPNLN